jgi:hypothetical protein
MKSVTRIAGGCLAVALALSELAIATAPAAAQEFGDASPDEEAELQSALGSFLFESLSAHAALRDQGLETNADRLWASAAQLVQIVRVADPEEAGSFLPLLDGLRRSLAETVTDTTSVDQAALLGIQEALDDQIKIYEAPGAEQGGYNRVSVSVNTIRGGAEVDNLYISFDLAGAVPKGASANRLTNVTSPATGRIAPGRYLLRVSDGQRELKRETLRVGQNGKTEEIDVILP